MEYVTFAKQSKKKNKTKRLFKKGGTYDRKLSLCVLNISLQNKK